MIRPVFLGIFLITTVFINDTAGLQCYSFRTEGSNVENSTLAAIPENGTLAFCPKKSDSCVKVCIREKKTVDGIISVRYEWGCSSSFEALRSANLPCSVALEVDDLDHSHGPSHWTKSERFCTCCGDACNNASMNAKCNTENFIMKLEETPNESAKTCGKQIQVVSAVLGSLTFTFFFLFCVTLFLVFRLRAEVNGKEAEEKRKLSMIVDDRKA